MTKRSTGSVAPRPAPGSPRECRRGRSFSAQRAGKRDDGLVVEVAVRRDREAPKLLTAVLALLVHHQIVGEHECPESGVGIFQGRKISKPEEVRFRKFSCQKNLPTRPASPKGGTRHCPQSPRRGRRGSRVRFPGWVSSWKTAPWGRDALACGTVAHRSASLSEPWVARERHAESGRPHALCENRV